MLYIIHFGGLIVWHSVQTRLEQHPEPVISQTQSQAISPKEVLHPGMGLQESGQLRAHRHPQWHNLHD